MTDLDILGAILGSHKDKHFGVMFYMATSESRCSSLACPSTSALHAGVTKDICTGPHLSIPFSCSVPTHFPPR